MSSRFANVFADLDWGLLSLILMILGFGLVMLTSASISVADNSTGQPFYYLIQQLMAVFAGILVAAFVLNTPTGVWERLAPVLFLLAVVLLLAVFIPGLGREVNGSTRWLSLGGINIQVSEPARLMVLMYISSYAVRHRDAFAANFIS